VATRLRAMSAKRTRPVTVRPGRDFGPRD
jgi:hypothetical protein